MANYPTAVKVAWDVIHQFIADWQENPYQWWTELDIQVEIASRLRLVLSLKEYRIK